MKKSILICMCIVLCLLAAGCTNSSTSTVDEANAVATQEPEATSDVPTLPPDEAIVESPKDYQYAQLASSSGNLTLDYPSTWTQIPGTSTICFVEPVAQGDSPARFTFTKKTLEIAPTPDKKKSQLAAFVRRVIQDYDSYELSPLSTDGSFLGDNGTYYVTYTVQSKGVTLKGYVIMATRDKSLYVYHFRVSLNDYESFYSVMTRIRDSITLN